jgi:hypothetical protein
MFLVSEVDLLGLFKAGHQKLVQVKNWILMPMRVDSDFRVMSGLTCSGS